jgi:hypothetical protein
MLSQKTKYAMVGLLLILNLVLRLPVTPHEIGADSFMMHAWASSLSATGYAKWILHPLSFFGLYPFSYASGELFLLSGISQSTGVEMEWTIWLAATFFGILGMFTAYVMAKEINSDFLFAFSVAFVYSTANMFLGFTQWTVSTRGLFVALLPLLIWSLLRCQSQKEDRLKYLLFSLSLLIILATIHQLIFFTPLILLAFVLSILVCTANKNSVTHKITPKMSIILFFALFVPLFLSPFTPLGLYHHIEFFEGGQSSGYFFHGSAPYHILLNMGTEYAIAIGAIIVLTPIGLFSLLLKEQKTFGEIFSVVLVLSFAPFLADPTYMSFFVLFIFSLLIGFGLLGILKIIEKVNLVKSAAPLIILVIVIFSALLPYFVVVRPVPSLPYHTSYMSELTVNAALFIKSYGIDIPRIRDYRNGYSLTRINAIAGPPYYHENVNNRGFELRSISIVEFVEGGGKYDHLYEVEGESSENFYLDVDCDCDWVRRALDNKTHLVIEDNYQPNNLGFHISLHETRPEIYDNGLESIWYLSFVDDSNSTNE